MSCTLLECAKPANDWPGTRLTLLPLDEIADGVSVIGLVGEHDGARRNVIQQHTLEKLLFEEALYKGRNAVERMFWRLKDFRRIATRYDKLATNVLGPIHLAAAFTWWL